jgi:hypothetical protein
MAGDLATSDNRGARGQNILEQSRATSPIATDIEKFYHGFAETGCLLGGFEA